MKTTQHKNSSLKLTVYTEDLDEHAKKLSEKLKQYNDFKVGIYDRESVLYLYHDRNDNIVAGLYGFNSHGRLYIDILWVDDHYRGSGLGSELLKMAETYAREKEDLYIRLNTASFQAPKFYLKHGYEEFAKFPIKTKKSGIQYDYYFIKYSPQAHIRVKTTQFKIKSQPSLCLA